MTDMFAGIGSLVSGLGVVIFLGFLLLLVLGIMIFLHASGMLVRRPYRVLQLIPRANGGFKPFLSKGRFLKSGKFEIFYSMNDKTAVNAPKESQIHEGNWLFARSESKDKVHWLEDIEIDDQAIKSKLALTEGMELAFAVQHDTAYKRTHSPNRLEQYFPLFAILIAALILGGAFVLATGQASFSNAEVVKSNQALTEQIARLMNNATIVVHQNAAEASPTTPSGIIRPGG